MPVSRPTLLNARWAQTTGGTDASNNIAPDSGTRDAGYQAGQDVPSGIMNWLFNQAYKWFAYVNDLANQTWSWTALHTFGAGISVTSGTSTLQAITGTTLSLSGNAAVGGNAYVTGTGNFNSVTSAGAMSAGSMSTTGTLAVAGTTALGSASISAITNNPTFPARANSPALSGLSSAGWLPVSGANGIGIYRGLDGNRTLYGAVTTSVATPGATAFTVPAGDGPPSQRVYMCPAYSSNDLTTLPVLFTVIVNADSGSGSAVNFYQHTFAGGAATNLSGYVLHLDVVRWNVAL